MKSSLHTLQQPDDQKKRPITKITLGELLEQEPNRRKLSAKREKKAKLVGEMYGIFQKRETPHNVTPTNNKRPSMTEKNDVSSSKPPSSSSSEQTSQPKKQKISADNVNTNNVPQKTKGLLGYNRSRKKVKPFIDMDEIFITPEPKVFSRYYNWIAVPTKELFHTVLELNGKDEVPKVPKIGKKPQIDDETMRKSTNIDKTIQQLSSEKNDLLNKITELQ